MTGLSSAALDRMHQVLARIDAGRDLTEVMQAVTDGVVELSGFTTAAISVPRGRHELEVVAVSGAGAALQELVGQRFSRESIQHRWSVGESYGRFVFVSHGLVDEEDEPGVLIPDFQPLDHPDAWHPHDELSAPLRDPSGELLGMLAVDLPADLKRPGRATLDLMEIFAMQAAIGISQAMKRERLREELWLRGVVRDLFTATGQGPLETSFDDALPTVCAEMAAAEIWVEVLEQTEGPTPSSERTWGGLKVPTVTAALATLGPALAEHARATGAAVALTPAILLDDHPALTRERRLRLRRAMEGDEVSRLLLAPLTEGRTLIGQVVLFRQDGRPWSDVEQTTVLEVGRALAWAIQRQAASAIIDDSQRRALSRQQQYAQGVMALSERAVQPMRVVEEYLTEQALPATHPARRAMDQFWNLYDNSRTLMEFQGFPKTTGATAAAAVDVVDVLDRVWDRLAAGAETRNVKLLPLEAEWRPWARTDPRLLEWTVVVLIEDLVHETTEGGCIRVVVTDTGKRVLLSCQGSGHDQPGDHPSEPQAQDHESWWLPPARVLLSEYDGTLVTRDGPHGRRAATLSLPPAAP